MSWLGRGGAIAAPVASCAIVLAAGQQARLPPLPADVPADARVYVKLAPDSPGRHVAWRDADGTVQALYQHTGLAACDTDLRSTIIVDAAGVPIRLNHTGRSCAPTRTVNETYYRVASTGRWQNAIEQGEGDTAGKRFYMSLTDVPEERALLVRALLASGGRVPLLPEGEAWLERVQELTVRVGDRTERVTHYRVFGLDLGPSPVWLDSRGELFALNPADLIRQGWESVVPELQRAQSRASQVRQAALERAIVTRPASPLVIHSARLFDSRTGETRERQTVVIDGARIQSVASTVDADRGRAGAIDASGATLLPGLWDAHGHNIGQGLQYLAAGVTGIRILAANADAARPRWQPMEPGTWRQTRLVPIAVIDGPHDDGRKGAPPALLARTPEDVRQLIDEHAAAGYRQIKMYNSLDPALVPVLIARTHERGLRASGHIPAGLSPGDAVRAGLDEIHHGEPLLGELIEPLRRGRAFAPEGQRDIRILGAGVDVEAPAAQAFIALLRDRRVTVDPTLVAVEKSWTTTERSVAAVFRELLPRLPLQERRQLIGFASRGYRAVPEDRADLVERHQRSFAALLKLVGAMANAGVPVLPGTDSELPGFALHRELELHVQAGIAPARVLQAATLGTPRAMGLDGDVGSIEPGKRADLILVEGDPTRAISNIRRLRHVIKDGAMYNVAAIYRDLGIQPTSVR